jgi:hypothetical protein
MKKILLWVTIAIIAVCAMGSVLLTKVAAYQNLVVSAAGAESILATGATTDFNPGIPSPGGTLNPVDIMSLWGRNGESAANGIILTCFATATANDTCEMAIYGIADKGAPERIADIIWIFGTARHTSTTVLWADTCTITTDSHISTVTATDSGNNFIAKLSFDATGYRYIYAIAHGTATGAATNITVKMRPY